MYDKGSHSFIKVLDSPVTGGYILDLQGGMNDGIMYTSGTSDKAISNTNCGESIVFEVKKGEIFGILGHNGAGENDNDRNASWFTKP